MIHAGYIAVNGTVIIPFSTNDSTGAAVTFTGSVSDIKVYKGTGTTPRASAAGMTLNKDFAGTTGTHLLVIDCSDNTDAGFWADSNTYSVVLKAVTVDTKTVSVFIGVFRIGVAAANLTQMLGTVLTETAGYLAAGFKKFFNIATPASTMDALTLVVTATNLTNAPANGDLTATMKASVQTAATAATPTAAAVTGAVGSVTAPVTLAASQPNYAPSKAGDAMTLTSAERDVVATALLDLANGVETNWTLRQFARIVLASAACKTSGMNTGTGKIRDTGDSKDRITATLDGAGNRTAVTWDKT
jgi:hypothetical protein